jgi:hypothetical protein
MGGFGIRLESLMYDSGRHGTDARIVVQYGNGE